MNDSERLALVDWFERALNYAMQPTRQGEGDDAERMARRVVFAQHIGMVTQHMGADAAGFG